MAKRGIYAVDKMKKNESGQYRPHATPTAETVRDWRYRRAPFLWFGLHHAFRRRLRESRPSTAIPTATPISTCSPIKLRARVISHA